MKRWMDVTLAAIAVALLSPLLVAVAAAIALVDGLPVVFRQTRIGRGFVPFTLYKFRTMAQHDGGADVTATGDARVTRTGRWLRVTKIDELPQLFNVLSGDMALVGPRPELPRYVTMYADRFEQVLSVRPGITGAASIEFRNESDLLAGHPDPDLIYIQEILPAKLDIEHRYVAHRSLKRDIDLLVSTISALFAR